MARAKLWLKLWTEIVHDPKVRQLSHSEKWAFVAVMCLAQDCHADGRLVMGVHSMSIPEIAKAIEFTERTDIAIVRRMIDKMISLHSLHWDGDALVVTNFKYRQETPPSWTKESNRQRQQERRGRLKSHNNLVTPQGRLQGFEADHSHNNLVTPSPNVSSSLLEEDREIPTSPPPPCDKTCDKVVTESPVSDSGVDIKARANRHESRAQVARVTRNLVTGAEIWSTALEEIQKNITRMNFTTWFEGSCGQALDNRTLVVAVKSQSVAEHLSRSHISLVEKALSTVSGQNLKVSFCVQEGSHD